MDYLSLIKKFWAFNEGYSLSAPVVAVYLFLLDNWEKIGCEDFQFSDKVMSKRLKINRKTIKTSKDTLQNLGLISYQITNGLPTLYKIIPDYLVRTSSAEKGRTTAKQVIKKRGEKSVYQLGEFLKTSEMPKNKSLTLPREVPKESISKNIDIPSFEEFMSYARTLDIYEEGLDVHLKIKYETWKDDGWVSGYNKPIVNWKQTLKNTMPYLRSNN